MDLSKFIDIKVFLLALFGGLFLSYILAPKKRVIYVYPNPSNTEKLSLYWFKLTKLTVSSIITLYESE